MPDEFQTMREIGGAFFGVSSHTVGRKLKELGLRTSEGKPSGEAFARGLVERKFTEDHQNYCWAWHTERTVPLLERAGLARKSPDGP